MMDLRSDCLERLAGVHASPTIARPELCRYLGYRWVVELEPFSSYASWKRWNGVGFGWLGRTQIVSFSSFPFSLDQGDSQRMG